MGFGIVSFVFVLAILQRKACDAVPTVTLTGERMFYDGSDLNIVCAVDQDVDLLSVSFFKGVTETIWINNPTTCTFFKLIPEDTSSYNTTCNSNKTSFTLTKYRLNISDDNSVWSCQMKSKPGGSGQCIGVNNPCKSGSITLSFQIATTEQDKTTTENNGTTDNNETGIQELPIIIGASVGGSVLVAIIITVSIVVRNKRTDSTRKELKGNKDKTKSDKSNDNLDANSHAKVKDETPNSQEWNDSLQGRSRRDSKKELKENKYGAELDQSNHETPNPAYQEWNDSLQKEHIVTKSNPNNEMSKAQMQSSNQSSNQISASRQDSEVKPLSKENVVRETKYVKPETTSF